MVDQPRPDFPQVIEVVVEIPSGSRNKYEFDEIEHFFATYKLLEDKQVEVYGWAGVDAALDVLRADRERWLAEHGQEA